MSWYGNKQDNASDRFHQSLCPLKKGSDIRGTKQLLTRDMRFSSKKTYMKWSGRQKLGADAYEPATYY